jgi:cell division protein FtsL
LSASGPAEAVVIIDRREETDRLVFRKFLVFFVDSFLVAVLIVLYIVLNIAGSNDRLKLAELESAKVGLEKEQIALRLNIEYLSSPEQIEQVARERFGMEPVTGDRIFIIRRSGAGQ